MSETVEIGDTEVEIRETEDGFEAVEVDDFERHLKEEHAGFRGGFDRVLAPSCSRTEYIDCDMVLEKDGQNYASQSMMKRLDNDERLVLSWCSPHYGDFQVGVYDRES